MELKLANRSIFDSLEEALSKRELIVTNKRQRKIGKTTALMLFAERKRLPVIVRQMLKRDYSKKYPNVQIFGHKEVVDRDGLPLTVLCDEGVPKKTIDFLRSRWIEVSGFLNESFTEEKSFSPVECVREAVEYIGGKYATPVIGIGTAIPAGDVESLEPQPLKSAKKAPLLQIELEDIDSVPRVFYKGEKITNRIAIDFEWRTRGDDKAGSTYIRIKHGNDSDKGIAVETKELAVGEKALEKWEE
ncbi:hypothetical protein [Bacillus subtilis]|uniref:hypothetical protein n=1 Tax=Bacillus sp. PS217 TaxID=2954722 RepID=UPI002E232379|nr:hypothetical protein [Bacillus subtilis]